MCSGGHFAGACLRGNQILESKTFHRYTTRRKQGGSQAASDASGRKAQSAGASLRRSQEMMLQQEIRQLLASWKKHIDASTLVFLSAHGTSRDIFLSYDQSPFAKRTPASTISVPLLPFAY